ncbi:metal-sensitive transcriptional regulator [Staphylococcus epidermidis]|jgi:DNA-binding FrmR family transcriptional regulator|uniref:metal-sensitive transcriptional regulator n=1 Tax=Staphylococcus epidermidis TaxID=1282 RepID=UPI00273893D8|nr:metal-sensitive transcriptional regulator [Staphylococcus epidermidis]
MGRKQSQKEAADHSEELSRLNKVIGQIAGIEKMILANRKLPEVVQQIRAARSALQALEVSLIRAHMASSIKRSVRGDADFDGTLEDLLKLIKA